MIVRGNIITKNDDSKPFVTCYQEELKWIEQRRVEFRKNGLIPEKDTEKPLPTVVRDLSDIQPGTVSQPELVTLSNDLFAKASRAQREVVLEKHLAAFVNEVLGKIKCQPADAHSSGSRSKSSTKVRLQNASDDQINAVWSGSHVKLSEKQLAEITNDLLSMLPNEQRKLEAKALKDLEEQALKADLCGLAISGGGIRSATFGLGILQGLAITGLLPRFDYLSTVSGGGYIGAWLSAWINRDGFEAVQTKLLPPRLQKEMQVEVEAEPIRHLRLYSNYLAPRPGLFSFDGWGLIAIYLRNLLLNQMILLLAVLSLFVGVRMLVEFLSIAHGSDLSNDELGYFILLPLAALLFPLIGIRRYVPINRADDVRKPFSLPCFWIHCVIPWIVAAYLSSVLFSAKSAQEWFGQTASADWKYSTFTDWIKTHQFFGNLARTVLAIAVLNGLLGAVAFSCRIWAFVSGLVTGAVGGCVLFLAWYKLLSISNSHVTTAIHSQNLTVAFAEPFGSLIQLGSFVLKKFVIETNHSKDLTVALVATLGVPICLGVFILTNFFLVGFCGSKPSELEREWWSSLNSRLMFVSAAWAVLFGTAVFGPWLLRTAYLNSGAIWAKIAMTTAGTGWIGLMLSGLKAAAGANSGPSGQRGFKEMLARIAPVMFLVTLFLGGSLITTWCAYDVYGWMSIGKINGANKDWYFWSRPNNLDLLTDLNEPTAIPIFRDPSRTIPGWAVLATGAGVLLLSSELLGWFVGVNTFSLQNLYANRLVRCYLGASKRKRTPDPVVNMDLNDDMELSALFPGPMFEFSERGSPVGTPEGLAFTDKQKRINRGGKKLDGDDHAHWGPLHIINGALNQKASTVQTRRNSGSSDESTTEEQQAEGLQFLERQAESFVFTPLYCGSEATGYCPSYQFAEDVKLGTAVAVSGAAVSPNMGYHSSPSITALLTVFNIRLGAWFGNPRFRTKRKEANPAASTFLLYRELAGVTNAACDHVYISDGGHFENMGVYELIRRRCRFIIAVDAGSDPKFNENVGRLVRQVRIDFGVLLEVDLSTATPGANGLCQSHVVVGRIHYGDVNKPAEGTATQNLNDPKFSYENNQGIIVWFKNSLTGDESGDLVNYAAMNPSFPYDTTVNQFFNEPQFESYRALGIHAILKSLVFSEHQILKYVHDKAATDSKSRRAFKGCSTKHNFAAIYEHWLSSPKQYVTPYERGNEAYSKIQATLRNDDKLKRLAAELYGTNEERQSRQTGQGRTVSVDERLMANEMFSLLENVFLTLDLENQFLHPVHQGWRNVFVHWANTPTLKEAWSGSTDKKTEGISTEYNPAFRRFIDTVRAPNVVKFEPANGADSVDPATTQIRITFDIPIGAGMSWVGSGPEFPKLIEGKTATWSTDKLSCTLPVTLEPNHKYTIGINSLDHNNFQSEYGVQVTPVLYTFTTGK